MSDDTAGDSTDLPPSLLGQSLSAHRLNWHPQVHRIYDEELYYLVIRFVQPRSITELTQMFMREASINYYCAYSITGYYDVLIRYWGTPQYRRRLLRVFGRYKNLIYVVKEFQASEIFYSWSTRKAKDKIVDLLGAEDEVLSDLASRGPAFSDRVNALALDPTRSPDHDELRALRDDHLVIEKPFEYSTALKVVLVLQPTALVSDDANLSVRVLEAVQESLQLDVLSFYGGAGDLGRYILRFGIKDFASLPSVMATLDDILGPLPLRTMTLPLVELIGHESDNINNTFRLNSSEHTLVDTLEVPIEKFQRLSVRSREIAMDLFAYVNSVLERPEPWASGKRALRAAITEDSLSLRESLSFILDFEFYFREYARSRFIQRFPGQNWQEEVQDRYSRLFRNVPPEDLQDFDKWPLGVVHAAMVEAATQDVLLRGTFGAELGDDWAQTSRGVLNLRNPFAHGKLIRNVKQLSSLDDEWGEQLRRALIGMSTFRELYKLVESEDNGGQDI